MRRRQQQRVDVPLGPMGTFFSVFFAILYALIVYGKIAGTVNWSWWRVLAPVWSVGTVALLILFGAFVVTVRDDLRQKANRAEQAEFEAAHQFKPPAPGDGRHVVEGGDGK